MAVADPKPHSEPKVWNFFKLPFRNSSVPSSNSGCTSSKTTSSRNLLHNHNNPPFDGSTCQSSNSVSSVARSFLPTRRRLKLDPSNKLFFPYEPGKQVRSAIRIKNTSKSHVAFKFQTTAPKSCFMRPPGAVLAPGESIIATVFKFVEQPENNEKPDKTGLKFKIMSLKVKELVDYVPELFEEQKDHVTVEQILRVVFLDPERPSPALEKLKSQLAYADAALEARKKPAEDAGPKIIGEGLVIDEWKERRERYLAKQQGCRAVALC
ncbi:hypothetical protein Lal_00026122 [Lupinus albus]|uniref:Putative major sperm protein (MSP) n=1 Tax=Lupinus albus TaxID=3870 RepID=A0A6A5LH15_LUPAL|nr:putative major sperm protein (MSP) [Lupinus albus]KAF1861704.1 hypothetical protein Lal_00026122 [Lupinus albus]